MKTSVCVPHVCTWSRGRKILFPRNYVVCFDMSMNSLKNQRKGPVFILPNSELSQKTEVDKTKWRTFLEITESQMNKCYSLGQNTKIEPHNKNWKWGRKSWGVKHFREWGFWKTPAYTGKPRKAMHMSRAGYMPRADHKLS